MEEAATEEDRLEKVRGQRIASDELRLPYWAELWDSAIGMSQWLIQRQPPASCRVMDLGCGMGLTGTVAASLGLPVLFADLESPALMFAKLNSLRYTAQARARQLNWRITRLHEQFDLILGADILYERKQWEDLELFWRTHLAPGGSVVLGEPSRKMGDDFPTWITSRGWRIERHLEPITGRSTPIRLFEIRR